MKPSDRLVEIENNRICNMHSGDWYSMPQDINWLIARCKKLTEALNNYCKCEPGYKCIACKALEGDE
jgi:hypothetical protein